MRVVGRGVIDAYSADHADARDQLEAWYLEAEDANWRTPQDIRNRYSSASFLSGNLVIFNIKGKKYRLVTKVAYPVATVLVKWVGTHAEYSKRTFQ